MFHLANEIYGISDTIGKIILFFVVVVGCIYYRSDTPGEKIQAPVMND